MIVEDLNVVAIGGGSLLVNEHYFKPYSICKHNFYFVFRIEGSTYNIDFRRTLTNLCCKIKIYSPHLLVMQGGGHFETESQCNNNSDFPTV